MQNAVFVDTSTLNVMFKVNGKFVLALTTPAVLSRSLLMRSPSVHLLMCTFPSGHDRKEREMELSTACLLVVFLLLC